LPTRITTRPRRPEATYAVQAVDFTLNLDAKNNPASDADLAGAREADWCRSGGPAK